jgi:hypothetical protein
VRAQFDGHCRHQFSALEDLLCQLIPRHLHRAVRRATRLRPLLHRQPGTGNNSRSGAPARTAESGGVHPDPHRSRPSAAAAHRGQPPLAPGRHRGHGGQGHRLPALSRSRRQPEPGHPQDPAPRPDPQGTAAECAAGGADPTP